MTLGSTFTSSTDCASFDDLGSSASAAIQLVNKLRAVGADTDLDIPRIAFAGKQSAGKSSLVEALTGIQLPRSHGTCTRCPIEVTTTKITLNEEWSCTIQLRFVYDDSTNEKLPKPKNKLFCHIDDNGRKDIAQKIKDAQEEILKEGGIKFTRNIICIDIHSNDCQDLSIVDLPGLIESTDHQEDEIYINLISELVYDYIKCDNTVILQCMASDEDVENQKIRTMARNVDPDGQRSIGVLTKPDKVEMGTERGIIEILTGQKYALRMGYFVVRTPNPKELDELSGLDPANSFSERDAIEKKFFESHPMGSMFKASSIDRCGSNKLVFELSFMLKKMIDEQISPMQEKLKKVINKTSADLDEIGTAIRQDEAREIVSDECRKFSARATVAIQATKSLEKSFWHSICATFVDFKRKIEECSPVFEINGKIVGFNLLGQCAGKLELVVNAKEGAENGDAITLVEQVIGGALWCLELGDRTVALVCKAFPRGTNRIRTTYVIESNAATNKLEGELTFSDTARAHTFPLNNMLTGAFRVDATINIQEFFADNSCTEVYTVAHVRKTISLARGRELPLPGKPQYDACESIIVTSIQGWETPAKECVEIVQRQLRELVVGSSRHSLLETMPSRFKFLCGKAREVIDGFVVELGGLALDRVHDLCSMQKRLFTFNEEDISSARAEFIAAIKKLLDKEDAETHFERMDASVRASVLESLQRMGLTEERLLLMNCEQQLGQQEIETMAGALAYFKVKVSAFIDHVLEHIQFHLLDKFEEECEKMLRKELGVNSDDDSQLMRLLAEDASLSRKRKTLARDLARQKDAMELIDNHLCHR